MFKNRRKFCFIICINDETCFQECCLYINQLKVPDGYTVELIPIRDAKSMASAYNAGMISTDAKYKIYMHQNLFIINTNFLYDTLTVFARDRQIGMMGLVGSEHFPSCGVMWYGERIGNLYSLDKDNTDYSKYRFAKEDVVTEVEAIDGLMMVTNQDILWREDLFDGWDFYDIAQSFEFRKKGYKVVVPEQTKPWAVHDEGTMNLWGYDEYRKRFLTEYKDMLSPDLPVL